MMIRIKKRIKQKNRRKKRIRKKKKRRRKKDRETKPLIEEKFDAGYGEDEKTPNLNLNAEEEKVIKQRKKEINAEINKLGEVFKRIEQPEQEKNEESVFDEKGNLRLNFDGPQNPDKFYNAKYGYVNPASNNLPLFGK